MGTGAGSQCESTRIASAVSFMEKSPSRKSRLCTKYLSLDSSTLIPPWWLLGEHLLEVQKATISPVFCGTTDMCGRFKYDYSKYPCLQRKDTSKLDCNRDRLGSRREIRSRNVAQIEYRYFWLCIPSAKPGVDSAYKVVDPYTIDRRVFVEGEPVTLSVVRSWVLPK